MVPRLLTRWLFRQAQVERNDIVAPGLHRIEISGPDLSGARWIVGDKLQLKTGAGLQTRTYTPLSWDAEQGRTAFLAHTLAPGPGSTWVRQVRHGQSVAAFGPRRSLDLASVDAQRGILIGDETAIGLAAAWQPSRAVLEVNDAAGMQPAIHALGVNATLVARQSEAQHLDALGEAMLAQGLDKHFVLVGRARTLQYLLRLLRRQGVASSRILTKAYWADGKVGLD